MVNLEQLVINLKEKYNLCAVKMDLAAEIITQDELQKVRLLTTNCGVELTVKIGGCDALTDVSFARSCNAQNILVPMIETPYAVDKSIETIRKAYSNMNDINVFINIESITGVQNIETILNTDGLNYVKGIVLGRDDLTKSLNLDLEMVNSDQILEITSYVANVVYNYDKEFIIGGKVLPEARDFMLRLPADKVTKIETRKITFNADIIKSDYEKGISKALEFEYIWLDKYANNDLLTQKRKLLLENYLYTANNC